MKFTTTYHTTFRTGIGRVPKSWIECKSKTHEDCIVRYFYQNIKLYDWDTCGDETYDFLFDDGRAFRLEYSWWSEWHHEDEELIGLRDEYYINEIASSEANVPTEKARDWI